MNKLAHLPEDKQRDIVEIIEVIKDVAMPEKIILFGSFARGDWVDDEYVENGITYTYRSDYDLLVVLADAEKEKEHDIASKIENRTLKYENDVSPIVHTIRYINKGLEMGQYFFRDIVKEGIVLFDSGEYTFIECKPLTKEQEKALAIQNFNKWVRVGSSFLDGTKSLLENALSKGLDFRQVVFNLNQTAEKFYGGVLLVYTGYKPKTHRLKVYRKYAKHISGELTQIFKHPVGDSEEYRLFEILNNSYIDARYQDDYYIALEDLEKLIIKVELLEQVSIDLCTRRIDQLC